MEKERINQIENELDKITNMYVDTSYIQMLNGFKELDKYELVETIKDIWRFAAIHYECPVEEYRTFMNENIRSRFVHLRCMYTKHREQLLSEMVEYLNKTLVKGIYDDTTKMVQLEPAYNLKYNQFNTNEKHNNWEFLKSADIYADSKEQEEFRKKLFVEEWNEIFKANEELFYRTFGIKYTDVESWAYERWVDFHSQCKTKDVVLENKKPRYSSTNEEKLESYNPNTIFENKKVNKIIKDDKDKANTINPEKWMWLIENHEQLVITQEIQTYYKLMNSINKSMYRAICDLKFADSIGDTILINGCIRVIHDNINIADKFPHYSYPDMFLVNMCKEIYEERNPHKNAGRPKGTHIIKMIDVETEEVFERFDCRQSIIDTIGIKKSRLSKCLSTYKANPNTKSTWVKYKYEGKRYWFVEEN